MGVWGAARIGPSNSNLSSRMFLCNVEAGTILNYLRACADAAPTASLSRSSASSPPTVERRFRSIRVSLASAKFTVPIALMISRRPTTDDPSIGSPIRIAELRRPITGTKSKVKEVVIAGNLRATVTNAQKGNAVINGPL